MSARTVQGYVEVDRGDIEHYLVDESWVAEQKFDGTRAMVDLSADPVSFTGKLGQELQLPRTIAATVRLRLGPLTGNPIVLDCELMADGHLWVFDLLQIGEMPLGSFPLERRRFLLEQIGPSFPAGVEVVPQFAGEAAKRELWEAVVAGGREGVIFKHLDGTVTAGSGRTRQIVKAKVTRTVDCVVVGVKTDGKDSCDLALVGADGALVPVGRCSRHLPVEVGDVAEIRFLYVNDPAAPRLYQPRIVRIRTDKDAAGCDLAQLDGAATRRDRVAI